MLSSSKPKLLSILMCTIVERSLDFAYIYNNLTNQIKNLNLEDEIEILYFSDNRKYTVGYKRNYLLSQSKAEYTCFVDDDDDVSDNYIKLIYEALKGKPDCLSLQGIITVEGVSPKLFIHSIRYKSYYELNNVYYRPPNHLNVIKRSIAIKFKFKEINHGEDTEWAMRICKAKVLKLEKQINAPYYFYKFTNKK